MSAPTVTTTNPPTSILFSSARMWGNLVSTGGKTVTNYGFELNTTPYTNGNFLDYDSLSLPNFSKNKTGLTPGITYYFRAFATNADGTGYGSWESFTTPANSYSVTIAGVDRTTDVMYESISIDDIINDQANTCSLLFENRSGLGIPQTDDEIIIVDEYGTTLFAGTIVKLKNQPFMQEGGYVWQLQCVDYTRLLDGSLVHKSYESMTDAAIIYDIVTTYAIGKGITTTNVVATATINQITFNYLQPSQCLRKICELTGNSWYIDYSKDIHYFPLNEEAAPTSIEDGSQIKDFVASFDASQLKNRVYVRGGTKLSDFTTYIEAGDGQKTKFVLPDKPHDVSVEVDTGAGYVTKTLGIKNIDTSGFDWYLNFQEKYLEQDSGGAVLTTAHKIKVTYKYDIPILIAQDNSASIADSGVHEYAIFDKSITTTEAARDRAAAELTDYANSIVEASFMAVGITGWRSGQTIYIELVNYGIAAYYTVQRVRIVSTGGGRFDYQISVASSKTLGIIKFLVKLLEANKNLIELDDNEVVDELMTVSDTLLDASLTDTLTIDSAGPYYTWVEPSPSGTVKTRMRWDLFQWG